MEPVSFHVAEILCSLFFFLLHSQRVCGFCFSPFTTWPASLTDRGIASSRHPISVSAVPSPVSISGNLLTRSRLANGFTYPAAWVARPHAPISLGTRQLTYDSNGNMTNDGERSLTWDAGNRLSTVIMPSNNVARAVGEFIFTPIFVVIP